MKLLLLFLSSFLFFNFTVSHRIDESVVELFHRNSHTMFYGIVISPTSLLVPWDVYKVYYELIYRTEYGTSSMPSGDFRRLNNVTYIFETDDFPKEFYNKKMIQMGKFSVCEGNENLKTIAKFNFGSKFFDAKFEPFSVDKCKNHFPSFDEKTQICGVAHANIPFFTNEPRLKPLIATINDTNYVVGLSDSTSLSTVTLFNVFGKKCFPIYSKCDYISSFSEFTHCNGMEVSMDLKNFNHSEILLTENGYLSNNFDLAIVVNDYSIILFCDKSETFNNYIIYGNGLNLTDFKSVNITKSNVKTASGKFLRFVKFENPVFRDYQAAKFFFDKSQNFTPNFDEKETLQFIDEKLGVQKSEKDESENVFPFMTPIFLEGKVIGFKNDQELIPVDMTESIYSDIELSQRTTTTTTTDKPEIVTTSSMSKTTVSLKNNGAQNCSHLVWIFWLLILTFFIKL